MQRKASQAERRNSTRAVDVHDPWLEMTCNVADGVTAANIEYTIERYSQALDAFARQFNIRR